jgi:hypothetical protein
VGKGRRYERGVLEYGAEGPLIRPRRCESVRKRAVVAMAIVVVSLGAWVVASGVAEANDSLSFSAAQVSSQGNDDLVAVALITFGVAVGAMAVMSLGYLLRVRLGLVKPPPPPDEQHGSH